MTLSDTYESARADFSFLEGLFSTLPFASDDLEARRALWNVIARLLARVNESEISVVCLSQYILVLLSKSDIIEDDLLDIQLEDSNEESQNSFPPQIKPSARTIAVSNFIFFSFGCSFLDFSKLACTNLLLTLSNNRYRRLSRY